MSEKMIDLTFLYQTSDVIVLRFGHFCTRDIRLSPVYPERFYL